MEIIRLPGYTEDEKVEIAKRHLLPKLAKDHGLKEGEWIVPDEAIRDLIRYYTREAGVRSLEREMGNLARKAVRDMAVEKIVSVTIDDERLRKYAGVRKFHYGETDEEDQVGIVTGLAYTDFGGDILTIEAVKMPGKGRMSITGNLKDVMKESISAAASFVRSRATKFGISPPDFEKTDVHLHVPEGATPKDGPSAGVAMAVAITSVLTGIPIRKDLAMTGEITLRGRVLPIGGLKEKLLAALRSGVKTVLIPSENEKDLAEVPENVKSGLEIIPVATVDDVLARALTRPLIPIEWMPDDAVEPRVADDDEDEVDGVWRRRPPARAAQRDPACGARALLAVLRTRSKKTRRGISPAPRRLTVALRWLLVAQLMLCGGAGAAGPSGEATHDKSGTDRGHRRTLGSRPGPSQGLPRSVRRVRHRIAQTRRGGAPGRLWPVHPGCARRRRGAQSAHGRIGEAPRLEDRALPGWRGAEERVELSRRAPPFAPAAAAR